MLSLIVKSQESAEIIIDMFMVALMKISKLFFTLFEMDDQSFPLPPLDLSERENFFFHCFPKGDITTWQHEERGSLNEDMVVFQGTPN